MTMIEYLSRTLSYLSLLGLFTLIRSPSGIWGGIVWLPKLWASAWAPILALMGGLGSLLGGISGDFGAILAGILGAVLGVRHTFVVTRPHDGFAEAFGRDWQERFLALMV